MSLQAKFGSFCRTSSKLMFALGRNFPQLLTGLKLDVSKLSIRLKPIPIPNRTTNQIHCRVGYVTMQQSNENTSHNVQQKETTHEIYNEKILNKINEMHEDIHKTQLRFTQELNRLSINLSKMFEK